MKKGVLAIAVIILAAFAGQAQDTSSVPPLINYQGMLGDAEGKPLSGTRKLTFNIYDAAIGGNLVWGPQVFESVPFINGRFNVILGSTDTTGRLITNAFSAKERYLGVTVGSNPEIAPRQQLLSSPFAINANMLDNYDLNSLIEAVMPDSGSIFRSYTANTDWNLDKGSGSREYRVKVDFKKTFKQAPTVEVSFKTISVSNGTISRVSVSSENITNTGFDLVFFTWSDTIVYAIGATWIAYGW